MSKPPPDPFFVLRAHQTDITAIHFANEFVNISGPVLISGSKNGDIFVWNLQINRVQVKLHGHNGKMITWLDYFKQNLISQAKSDFICIWKFNEDDETWIILKKLLALDFGFCPATLFNYNEKSYLIIPNKESTFDVKDYDTNDLTAKVRLPAHGMSMCIKTCLWKDEMFVVCGFEDGTVIAWNVEKGHISDLTCHKDPVFCLDFDIKYRQKGISGSADKSLKIWNIDENFQLTEGTEVKLNSGINCVSIRHDGKIVIAGCWDGNVRVFSWKTLKPLAVLNFHKDSVTCMQFCTEHVNKNNSVFATGSKDFNIALWAIY